MHVSWFVLLLAIGACAPKAFVETNNAPVARGNLNSVGAALGTVYLYDLSARTMTRITNPPQVSAVVNRGSYSQNVSDDITIDFRNVPIDAQPSIRSQIGSSLEFKMSEYEQDEISDPGRTLNSPQAISFFENEERARANDANFRYVLIVDSYRGEDISIQWNGRPVDQTSFNIDMGTPGLPQVEVNIKNGSGVTCQGMQNTCVFTAQVYRLLDEGGRLRFQLDTTLTSPDRLQRMFNGNPLDVEAG